MGRRKPKPPAATGRIEMFVCTITYTIGGVTKTVAERHVRRELVDGRWVDVAPGAADAEPPLVRARRELAARIEKARKQKGRQQ